VTEQEADTKIKLLLNSPFARVIHRDDHKPCDRFFVGLMPYYGVGASWEEAFANLKHFDRHFTWRPFRFVHKCGHCRARRSTLKAR
jgi:hypothetical protein